MQRVSDVGVAAGEAWRSLSLEQKTIYEEQSVASKVCHKRHTDTPLLTTLPELAHGTTDLVPVLHRCLWLATVIYM